MLVEVEDDAGAVVMSEAIDPHSAGGQKKIFARVPNLTLNELVQYLRNVPPAPNVPYSFEAGEPADGGEFTVYLRGRLQPLTQATAVTRPTPKGALLDALRVGDYPAPEPLVQWEGADRLACLDIDYHTLPFDQRPTEQQLAATANGIQPRPVAWHTSHGRGCKLYYAAERFFSAAELAACGGLAWRTADGRATFEVKHDSRHPLYPRPRGGELDRCGRVSVETQSLDLPAVAAWLGRGADPAARDAWLADNGLRVGDRLPHSQCRIAPELASTHADPVHVGEFGLYCYKCAGDHRCYNGRRAAGVVPYSALVGGMDSLTYSLVKHCAHWPHAKHVLSQTVGGALEPLLKLAYQAALKMVHGNDPRIPHAVTTPAPLVRVADKWLLDGRVTLDRNIGKTIIARLPAAKRVTRQPDGSHKMEVDAATVDELRHGGNDLLKFGLPELTPVIGMDIWGQFLPHPGDRIPFLVPRRDLPEAHRPRYRPPGTRMNLDAAWGVVERFYPGACREYVELIIAAKGVAQGGAEIPMVAVAGVSGAGKTQHVALAGGIMGDTPGDIQYTADTIRLRQSVMRCAERSDVVAINEISKTAERMKLDPVQAFDPLINLTPRSESWQMYHGSMVLGRCMALVTTDISLPEEVIRDKQLARRLVYVRLPRRVPNWVTTAVAAGIQEPAAIRAYSQDAAEACDAILSHVIDAHFRARPDWRAVARSLGFPVLEERDEHQQEEAVIRAFFAALCDAPAITGTDARRLPGKGWKEVRRDFAPGDELSELWSEMCDNHGTGWAVSRRCEGIDLCEVLRDCVLQNVRLDKYRHGARLFIRFVAETPGRTGKTVTGVNQEITGGTCT